MSEVTDGVTGRDVILRIIASALDSTSSSSADRILKAILDAGYVCVPRKPTKTMLDAAWADALAEDAKGVRSSMVNVARNEETVSA